MSNDFTQKVCPRCRVIYMGLENEPVCMTCKQSLVRAGLRKNAVRKQTEPPENTEIECLIQRDSSTIVTIGGAHYTFKPNKAGHSVCSITNPNHHKFLIRQPELYRVYQNGMP
jgi:hypothetical protein